ncbi:MAG TPA: ABC transporter permease [Opitutus sp.]|nr:ABC transporter permease [Opitutus sp.]
MSAGFERVIRARRGWVRLDLAGLWRFRDLLWLTIRRDFVARYQQTVLGPLWFIIQPIITAVVFTAVFGGSVRSAQGPRPFLFYLGGMLLWSYFSNVVSGAGNTFHVNAAVFTKVYFPRLIAPVAVMLSSLVPLVIQMVVFLAVYAQNRLAGAAGWHADPAALLLLPWCVVQTGLFALGLSLLTSALSAKYRDLTHALPFVLQMWLFVTPVIFPLEHLGRTARAVALLNPLTPIIEAVRRGFFGNGEVSAGLFGGSIAITAVVLAAGLVLFQRAERTFADTV